MGINKVEIMENGNARTLVDLTDDTVTEETLAEGATAHNAKGERITGMMKQVVDGGPVAWDDVQNKPFTKVGGDTLTWDGNTEGLTSIVDGMLIKVSNVVPTLDDLSNGYIYKINLDSSLGEDGVLTEQDLVINTENDNVLLVGMPDGSSMYFAVVISDTTLWGENVTKGLYFWNVALTYGDWLEGTSLTINGYTGFGKEVIKTEALPSHLQFGLEKKTFVDENLEIIDMSGDGSEFGVVKEFDEDMSSILKIGETCSVTWGDDVYKCEIIDFYGAILIGNSNVFLGGDISDGEPFVAMYEDTENVLVITDIYAQEERTVYFKLEADAVKKLDEKYLPFDLNNSQKQVTLYLDVAHKQYLSKESGDIMSNHLITRDELFDLCDDEKINIRIVTNWTLLYCTPLAIVGFRSNSNPYATVYYLDAGEIKTCYTAEYTE